MNSIAGKSTGIALLLAAALLAALFSMGVFNATGVGAQAERTTAKALTPSNVEHSSPAVNATDAITVSIDFDIPEAGIDGDTITLPLGGYVPVDTDTGTPVLDLGDATLTQSDGVSAVALEAANEWSYDAENGTATIELGAPLPVDDDLDDADRITLTIASVAPPTAINCLGQSEWALESTADGDAGTSAAAQLVLDEATTKNISSCEPGAAIRVEIGGTSTLAVGVNEELTVSLKGFVVPGTIGETRVLVYNQAGVAENPGEVAVSGTTVTLTVPDFNPAEATQTGLVATEIYSVVFKQSAGITNPAEAGEQTISVTDNDQDDDTTDDVDEGVEEHTVTVQRVIKLSKTSGKRGIETVATLKGFANDTATVSLVAGGETTEIDQVEITDNVGTLTIDTTSSDFKAGKAANEIIATDSAGSREDVSGKFTITPTAVVDPTETSVSKTVDIKLSDWTEAVVIDEVKIGNITLTPDVLDDETTTAVNEAESNGLPADPEARDIGDDGKLTLEVRIPSDVNRGTQSVKVSGSIGEGDDEVKESATATLKIGVLTLDIQPSTVVPGQQITIQGSGFVRGDEFHSVVVEGTTVTLSPEAEASSAGDIVITINVPSSGTGIGHGTKTVSVTASGSNRIGEGKIEVPKASITLSPTESRRGETVNASGTGFPAGDLVQIKYERGDDLTTVAAGSADASGAVNIDFIVPSYANIGSEHDVEAVSIGVYASVTAEATHTTPGAAVTLSSTTISSGESITITGMNFPAFATVAEMMIGGVDVRPVPAPATSIDGDFSTTVLVPQLELGNQTVSIRVSQTTVTTFLNIGTVAESQHPADLFADLIEAGALDRIFLYDNTDQTWYLYDPDPGFEAANTLEMLEPGDIIWIQLKEAAEVQGENLLAGWSLITVQ